MLSRLLWFSSLAFAADVASGILGKGPSAELVYQFSPPTWVENLAVRPNGFILPITTTSAVLNQLNPSTGSLNLVHDFSEHGNAIQSITEVTPDLFALNVLTCSVLETLTCTPGTSTIFTVDLTSSHGRKSPARVRKVAAFPDAGLLNGMAVLHARRGIVLLADSLKAGIWSLNVWTGETRFLFADAAMNGTASVATCVNGIRVRGSTLFFTTSAQGTFNRIPIDPATGAKTGEAKVIATGLAAPDDFEVDLHERGGEGVGYVCNGFLDQVLRIELGTGESSVLASVPGPTSVRWGGGRGRDGRNLNAGKVYVSTIGGLLQYVAHNVTVGGAVYEIVV